MVESEREVCGSVRVEGKNPESVWWNDEVKAEVERKEAVRKDEMGARDETAIERCMEAYKREKRKIKRLIYLSKKEVND